METRSETAWKGTKAMRKSPPRRGPAEGPAVTADRIARLFRLVESLARRPTARAKLVRQLGLNQRGFYRDIEFLRGLQIDVVAENGRYSLAVDFDQAVARMPFPDPHLTLGEALSLAKGRTAAHKVLQSRVQAITQSRPSSRR